jgi:hypothetical protein
MHRCNNDDPSQQYAANAYGYSRVLTRGDESTHRVLTRGDEGTHRVLTRGDEGIHTALRQVTPGSALTRCSRVLTGYSQSTHGYLPPHVLVGVIEHLRNGAEVRGTLGRPARGTHGVLTGYSRRTHGVLTAYSQRTHGVRPTNSNYCPGLSSARGDGLARRHPPRSAWPEVSEVSSRSAA